MAWKLVQGPVDPVYLIDPTTMLPFGAAGGPDAVPMSLGLGSIAVPSIIHHGQKTVAAAGTPEAIGGMTTLYSGVRVKALHGNTGWIYVGDSSLNSLNGYVLDAGEEVFLEVDNLARVFIDASVGGEGVSYIGS